MRGVSNPSATGESGSDTDRGDGLEDQGVLVPEGGPNDRDGYGGDRLGLTGGIKSGYLGMASISCLVRYAIVNRSKPGFNETRGPAARERGDRQRVADATNPQQCPAHTSSSFREVEGGGSSQARSRLIGEASSKRSPAPHPSRFDRAMGFFVRRLLRLTRAAP